MCLASSLRSIGAIRLRTRTASFLALFRSLLLLLPGSKKSLSAANRLEVIV